MSEGITGSAASALPGEETDPIRQAVVRQRTVPRRHDILRQSAVPEVAHVLLSGHTYRYRLLRNGRRQITAILMPGDMCDLSAVVLGRADYGVASLTACTLGEIPIERIRGANEPDPVLYRSLRTHSLRDASIAREWVSNIGRRSALERIAHLFCETYTRKSWLGLADEDGYDTCLTQFDLADVLGLTHVHVNRMLGELRDRGLIRRERGRMTLLDRAALEELAGFDPAYLQ